MQLVSKVLLGAFAVCAVAQGQRVAHAQSAPDSNQQQTPPVANPDKADPANPISPTDPANPTNPATPDSNPPPISPPPASEAPPPVVNPDTAATNDTTTDVSDPSSPSYDFSYAWFDPRLRSGIGVSATLGGGVVGFTDKAMRNTTSDVGGLWDLRVTLGSHVPLGLDISYLGSATDIKGLAPGQSATLIGTTAEAALRYNVLPHFAWNPYVFAGAGWQRYDVSKSSGTLMSNVMSDHDNLVEFPVGTGVAYRRGGLVADLRGTFRATTEENLVLSAPGSNGDFVPMHTWEASAALGYEF
jgi:hypothetical protein